jgi:hypothetical protein
MLHTQPISFFSILSLNIGWGVQIIKLLIILLLTRWWLFIHIRLHVTTVKCSSWDCSKMYWSVNWLFIMWNLHFAS